MSSQCIFPVRLEKLNKFFSLLGAEARTNPNVLESTCVIKQSKQQRAHHRALAFLVPAKSSNHTVAVALVFDLDHDALVGFVSSCWVLNYDAVQTRAFKAAKPIRGNTS